MGLETMGSCHGGRPARVQGVPLRVEQPAVAEGTRLSYQRRAATNTEIQILTPHAHHARGVISWSSAHVEPLLTVGASSDRSRPTPPLEDDARRRFEDSARGEDDPSDRASKGTKLHSCRSGRRRKEPRESTACGSHQSVIFKC